MNLLKFWILFMLFDMIFKSQNKMVYIYVRALTHQVSFILYP